ncbi:hypothetical protein HMPREF2806_09595 [Corynebacterium sp. HMSC076G08]|uniref:hypothetical protein n=1 Tax=Corynebacterium sp. HMSC076G08 TaxID=1739310 RepID=UPI0008A55C04|nr:hypothetical protein [Corynebacterium sp. HMSC076G08]OFK66594.1 hypothetical protein HMPREF2806_09595 [Corynebacterium sp. HMSC076G08]
MALRKIVPVPESASGAGWSVKKLGGVVFLQFWAFSGRSLNLPAGFIPAENHSLPYRFGAIDVKTSGSVTIITGDYLGSVYATVSYPA